MARIFTTKFVFNHQEYDAIVTVSTVDGKMNFNVKVMDLELFDLIPGGHIRYEGREGFRDIDMGNALSHHLVNSIAVSIDQHLVTKP